MIDVQALFALAMLCGVTGTVGYRIAVMYARRREHALILALAEAVAELNRIKATRSQATSRGNRTRSALDAARRREATIALRRELGMPISTDAAA